jgi:hypothetical protein
MISKSGCRFFGKIMLKQNARARFRFAETDEFQPAAGGVMTGDPRELLVAWSSSAIGRVHEHGTEVALSGFKRINNDVQAMRAECSGSAGPLVRGP